MPNYLKNEANMAIFYIFFYILIEPKYELNICQIFKCQKAGFTNFYVDNVLVLLIYYYLQMIDFDCKKAF